MLKLLLLIGVLVGVYYLFFKKKAIKPSSSERSSEEIMIPCAKCDTYVQSKEAFSKEGKHYCCRECMED